MIVLGIDPGSRVTGYGLLETSGNRMRMIDSGAIKLKSSDPMGARLVTICDRLEEIVQNHRPDAVALEKVFHGVNFSSTLKLGYVRGVVMLLAQRHDLTLAEYNPTEVKKSVSGYGRAEKAQVQEMVRVLLNLREVPKPHDVSDALAIAICHAHMAPVLRQYHGST